MREKALLREMFDNGMAPEDVHRYQLYRAARIHKLIDPAVEESAYYVASYAKPADVFYCQTCFTPCSAGFVALEVCAGCRGSVLLGCEISTARSAAVKTQPTWSHIAAFRQPWETTFELFKLLYDACRNVLWRLGYSVAATELCNALHRAFPELGGWDMANLVSLIGTGTKKPLKIGGPDDSDDSGGPGGSGGPDDSGGSGGHPAASPTDPPAQQTPPPRTRILLRSPATGSGGGCPVSGRGSPRPSRSPPWLTPPQTDVITVTSSDDDGRGPPPPVRRAPPPPARPLFPTARTTRVSAEGGACPRPAKKTKKAAAEEEEEEEDDEDAEEDTKEGSGSESGGEGGEGGPAAGGGASDDDGGDGDDDGGDGDDDGGDDGGGAQEREAAPARPVRPAQRPSPRSLASRRASRRRSWLRRPPGGGGGDPAPEEVTLSGRPRIVPAAAPPPPFAPPPSKAEVRRKAAWDILSQLPGILGARTPEEVSLQGKRGLVSVFRHILWACEPLAKATRGAREIMDRARKLTSPEEVYKELIWATRVVGPDQLADPCTFSRLFSLYDSKELVLGHLARVDPVD
eukprot:tig00000492_g1510.t1